MDSFCIHDVWMILTLASLLTLQGVDSVKFTCGGCQSGENSTEYYCSGEHRYLYFRCEGSGSSSLVWTVSSQDQDELIRLGSESPEENTIRRGNITIYVDTIDFTNGRSIIISYLWVNLSDLVSDVNISCDNGIAKMKTLKQLGSVQPPNSSRAAVYMSPTNETVVNYEWSHESPETVHHYITKIFINGTLTSTAMIPSDTLKDYSTVSQGTLRLEIEAVGLCGDTATHTIDENAFQYFQVSEVETIATTAATATTATTTDQCDCQNERSNSLSKAEAVGTAVVVSAVVGCFPAGLAIAWFFKRKRDQKTIDAESQTTRSINHLNTNDEIKKDLPNLEDEIKNPNVNDDTKANASESDALSKTDERHNPN